MTEIMKLKICGMKYEDNITQVAKLQPDYLGFIFYKNSPRNFDNIIPLLPNSIKKVGVFVNETMAFILEKIKMHQLNTIQLHGNESPEFCDALKRHYEKRSDEVISFNKNRLPHYVRNDKKMEIIKVFSIKDQFNFEVLQPYENVCDYYLFDTKGKLPGGNGYAFDWSVLNDYPSTKPYFLSGGIGLEQIESVLLFLQKRESKYCYAIDVNSKFEIKPGLKYIEQLKEFKNNLSHFE
jgi:phosphoribosylanthranilate isomerase